MTYFSPVALEAGIVSATPPHLLGSLISNATAPRPEGTLYLATLEYNRERYPWSWELNICEVEVEVEVLCGALRIALPSHVGAAYMQQPRAIDRHTHLSNSPKQNTCLEEENESPRKRYPNEWELV